MIVFGHGSNYEAEFFIFMILNLNFRGVPSIFQGIVPPQSEPNLMYVLGQYNLFMKVKVVVKTEETYF